jgi:hypothetical protein
MEATGSAMIEPGLLSDVLRGDESVPVKVRMELNVDEIDVAVNAYEHEEIYELYVWFCQVVKLEDSGPARSMLRLIARAVYLDAAKVGHYEALTNMPHRSLDLALDPWRSGYEDGWAIGQSEKAGDL